VIQNVLARTRLSCPRDRWQPKRGFDRALAAARELRLFSEVKPSGLPPL
jgi:hypothetical protein